MARGWGERALLRELDVFVRTGPANRCIRMRCAAASLSQPAPHMACRRSHPRPYTRILYSIGQNRHTNGQNWPKPRRALAPHLSGVSSLGVGRQPVPPTRSDAAELAMPLAGRLGPRLVCASGNVCVCVCPSGATRARPTAFNPGGLTSPAPACHIPGQRLPLQRAVALLGMRVLVGDEWTPKNMGEPESSVGPRSTRTWWPRKCAGNETHTHTHVCERARV